MSKRFGRNQKRKLRAEIDRLQGIETESIYWFKRFTEAENRIYLWAKSINQHLGSYHPLNERVQEVMLERIPYLGERYRLAKPMKFNSFMSRELPGLSTEAVFEFVRTVLHEVNIKRDDIGYRAIVELRSPDNHSYYAIDEEILFEGRSDPRFIDWMSREIAIKLSDHIASV